MDAHWKPLENRLGPERCVGFMFMGRLNGINLYKHGITRRYLNLDDNGNAYVYRGKGSFDPVDFEDALAWAVDCLGEGETLKTAYDAEYIARKEAALAAAGLETKRIEIEPREIFTQ